MSRATTSSISQLEITTPGIGSVLGGRYLAIPRYQRSYAWREQNVRDFLHDISGALRAGESEYFLGSVVISQREDGVHEVVDGQQRLATTTMLLAAIRDYFTADGDPGRASSVETPFLLTRDRRTQELRPKLTLNLHDNEFFWKTVLAAPGTQARLVKPSRESHERIAVAQGMVTEFVSDFVKTSPDPSGPLLDLVDYLERRAQVIAVEVPDHSNAFLIFETLNDRGLELSIADLLKNYLFGRAEDRIEEIQQRWNAMIGALETVGGEETVLGYLRHLWASMHGPTREKELYGRIREQIRSKQAVIDLAGQLERSSSLYAALLNPHHDVWRKFGPSAKDYMETLIQLKLEQFRPLGLAILEHLPDREVVRVLRFLVACSVRFLVVGGLGGGTMERVYSEAGRKVREGEIGDAKQLAKFMSQYVPPDAEFENAFAVVKVSQAYLARYYLAALERKAKGIADPEFVPNQNGLSFIASGARIRISAAKEET